MLADADRNIAFNQQIEDRLYLGAAKYQSLIDLNQRMIDAEAAGQPEPPGVAAEIDAYTGAKTLLDSARDALGSNIRGWQIHKNLINQAFDAVINSIRPRMFDSRVVCYESGEAYIG